MGNIGTAIKEIINDTAFQFKGEGAKAVDNL
jgi:hypothetical protein